LRDEGIVRHRGKIEAVIGNARRYEALRAEEGSLAGLIWRHRPATRAKRVMQEGIPAITPESLALSKALKARQWRFVGPTTMYALFQAMGLVNDHLTGCFRRAPIAAMPVPSFR
jgi:DNA-3-methyladenine glycosylase I